MVMIITTIHAQHFLACQTCKDNVPYKSMLLCTYKLTYTNAHTQAHTHTKERK